MRVRRAGFTLIEVAVLLAVVSILAAVVVPDFVEVSRNDLAEQAATEIHLIIDHAKWYYTNSGQFIDPVDPEYEVFDTRWPGDWDGDGDEDATTSTEDCLTGSGPAQVGFAPNVQHVDCDVGLLSNAALVNPWGEPYELNLIPANRAFHVRTNVPASSAGVMRAYLPGGECEAGNNGFAGGMAVAPQFCPQLTPRPAGFVTCCSIIPRPGREASFQAMVEEQTPDTSGACVTMGDNQDCDEGWTARGINCSGKNCSHMRVRCCPPGT